MKYFSILILCMVLLCGCRTEYKHKDNPYTVSVGARFYPNDYRINASIHRASIERTVYKVFDGNEDYYITVNNSDSIITAIWANN